MLSFLIVLLMFVGNLVAAHPDAIRFQQEVDELKADLAEIKHEIRKQKYANNAIGFTAYRSTTYDVVNDAACLFDEEVFDNDGAYDTSSGVFTCPVSGMYFFITTLYMGQNSGWYADSELQDSTGTKTLGGIFNNNAHTLQSTNQAVFQCDAGATVRVINRSDNTRRLAGTEGGRPMSTFSGFLISLT